MDESTYDAEVLEQCDNILCLLHDLPKERAAFVYSSAGFVRHVKDQCRANGFITREQQDGLDRIEGKARRWLNETTP